MKASKGPNGRGVGWAVVLLLFPGCQALGDSDGAEGLPGETVESAFDWEAWAEELRTMAEADQAYRDYERIMQMPQEEQQAFMTEGAAADRRHTARLKQVVEEHGWPRRSLVGEEAAHAAFILIQHADQDPEFQAAWLPVLEELASGGEVSWGAVAYLTDRVRVKQNRPQVYATQYPVVTAEDGSVTVDENGNATYLLPVVEDLDGLDARRREAGLEPWIDYELRMAASQGREPADAPLPAEEPDSGP